MFHAIKNRNNPKMARFLSAPTFLGHQSHVTVKYGNEAQHNGDSGIVKGKLLICSTKCYSFRMNDPIRIFKSAWFARAARKARIDDSALYEAIQQAVLGQAVDMGGGVFKKRLNQNRHRGIVLAKSGNRWVLEYLFAKQDKANIGRDELLAFRKLAARYADLTDEQVQMLLNNGDWMEITHDATIQE